MNDYDKDDPDSGGLSDAGTTPAQSAAIGSATGAPKQATPTKQPDDGYVPWSSFVSANQDVATREANKLQGQVQGDVDRAQSDISKASAGYDNGGDYQQQQPGASPGAPQASPRGAKAVGAAPGVGAQSNPSPRGAQSVSTAPQTATPANRGAAVATPPSSAAPQPQQSTTQQGYVDVSGNFQFGPRPPTDTPWATLGARTAAPAAKTVSGATPQTPAAQALMGYSRAMSMQPGANAANAPKDLEHQMGQSAWDSLVNEAGKAQGEANALGTEGGVQALLQQRAQGTPTGPVNSGFDAALINGQGAPGFQKLAQQYGKGQLGDQLVNAEKASQDKWSQLQGDAATRQAFDSAKAGAPAAGANPAGANPQSSTWSQEQADAIHDAVDKNWKGFSAYGQNGAVNALGSKDQFLAALKSGATYGDGLQWNNTPSVADQAATASKALGISTDQLAAAIEKMSPDEYQYFWKLGVVPPWMDVGTSFGKGVIGGWQSPLIKGVLSYGDDGGMWNALLNTWKNGAIQTLSGSNPVSAVGTGVKATTGGGKGISY